MKPLDQLKRIWIWLPVYTIALGTGLIFWNSSSRLEAYFQALPFWSGFVTLMAGIAFGGPALKKHLINKGLENGHTEPS